MAISTKSFPMSLFRFLKTAPCKRPQNLAGALRASQSIEEERTPHYDPRHFYPMHLHTTLANRYQVSAKLGWGISSTVWLAKDLHQWRWLPPRYVAIKVNANNYQSQESAEHELRITRHITRANPTHEGRNFVRTLLDSFELQGPHGSHVCMVFDVLYEPLWIFKARFKRNALSPDVLKVISPLVIKGLHYLHTQCHIIHTDLKSDNILMALGNQSVLDRVSQDEIASPLPQKKAQDRIIYLSRNDFGFQVENLGRPVITDFGLSVSGDEGPRNYPIQPNSFRAPEVVIGAKWDYSVDMWNLGALIWELLCGKGPFDYHASSSESSFTDEKHLAAIISLLGPPPADLLARGNRSSQYFDDDGKFKFPNLLHQEQARIENQLTGIKEEERKLFMRFILRILRWRPEERATAEELLSDPWLQQEWSS